MGRGGGEGARLDEPPTFQRGVAGKEGGETFQEVGARGCIFCMKNKLDLK